MSLLGRVLGYVRPYTGSMLAASLMLAISGALMAGIVSTVKPLISEVLQQQTPLATPDAHGEQQPGLLGRILSWLPTDRIRTWTSEHAFVEVPLLILAFYVLRAAFGYFGQYMMIRAGARVIRDMRVELFASVARQSPAFFREHPTGVIMSRILNDVQQIQRVVTVSLANGLRVAAMVPFLLILAFYHEWRMSLLVLVALPLIGYPMIRLGRKLRRASTASQQHMAAVAHKLNEAVGGVRVVQGFGMESFEVGRFREQVGRLLRAELKAGRASALAPALIELVAASIGAALLWIAGVNIAHGTLDPGNFAVVLVCLGLLFASTRRLNVFYNEIQRALASAVRLFDMLDRRPDVQDLPGAGELPPFSREIRFESVSFSYGDDTVLEQLELTISRGEVVALVGPSGAGKTTVAALLPRFYDPTHGRISVDGHDIRQVRLASLRSQIGIVTQETILFDDTVRRNIAYGLGVCPMDRVVAAARAAHAHDFIEQLPDGYETVVGERGARLSMGQRQRLAIARALLRDPPILVLDEATSALDAESEAAVQRALDELMRGRTSLVIAHRLATVRRADRIVVLEAGRIVEIGSHRELLERGGAYARLHEIQFREHPEESIG